MQNIQVKTHKRKRKNGVAVVRKHARKGGAKVKDLTAWGAKNDKLSDLAGEDCTCGKKGCKSCMSKKMAMVRKHKRNFSEPAATTTTVTKDSKVLSKKATMQKKKDERTKAKVAAKKRIERGRKGRLDENGFRLGPGI